MLCVCVWDGCAQATSTCSQKKRSAYGGRGGAHSLGATVARVRLAGSRLGETAISSQIFPFPRKAVMNEPYTSLPCSQEASPCICLALGACVQIMIYAVNESRLLHEPRMYTFSFRATLIWRSSGPNSGDRRSPGGAEVYRRPPGIMAGIVPRLVCGQLGVQVRRDNVL